MLRYTYTASLVGLVMRTVCPTHTIFIGLITVIYTAGVNIVD